MSVLKARTAHRYFECERVAQAINVLNPSLNTQNFPCVNIVLVQDNPVCVLVCTLMHACLPVDLSLKDLTSIHTNSSHNVTRLVRAGHSGGRNSAETGSLNPRNLI